MERQELIQSLINKHHFQTYLEIGVRDGNVFFSIECKKKVAVDPAFAFQTKQRIKRMLYSFFGSRFFDLTSDEFFERHADRIFKQQKLDMVLVDGMHEMRFALNDILHSLEYLSDDGFIIVHDCNPLSEHAACSFEEWKARNFAGVWNGDVWKSITYLLKNRTDLHVFVIDTDHGLGVIRKRGSAAQPRPEHEISLKEVEAFSFRELERHRTDLLNLTDLASARKLLDL